MTLRFLSTLSLRRATLEVLYADGSTIFLSTLSLRRATPHGIQNAFEMYYFYPRSPCGERPRNSWSAGLWVCISIHALLAESDSGKSTTLTRIAYISIHALLAESDRSGDAHAGGDRNFYPRSPCGERLTGNIILPHILLFLSTLSLRRATAKVHKTVGYFCAYETNFMEIASSC